MKNKYFIFNAFFIVFKMFCLSSCSQEELDECEIQLPVWPPEQSEYDLSLENELIWPKNEMWLLTLTTSESSETIEVSENEKSVKIKTNGFEPISVTVQPKTNGIYFFKPAGLIFPFETSFSWESGFCADCLKMFYLKAKKENSSQSVKEYAQRFNWQKMILSVHEKSDEAKSSKEELFYNPWKINQADLINLIFEKDFTLTALKMKKVFSINYDELFPNYKNVLSDYVIENYFCKTNGITFSKEKINKFLYADSSLQDFKLITAQGESKTSFSLAINSLPI